MRFRPLLLALSLVCAFAAPAFAFHVPPWDTGHQSFEPDPGDPNTDPGDDGQCKAGSPVEVATGNFLHSYHLFQLTGLGPPIDLTLTYNSHDRRRGPLGQGWVHPYDMRAVEVTDGTNVYAICAAGNGKRERFLRNAGGTYRTPAHDTSELSKSSDGQLTIREKDGSTQRFSPDGLVVALADRNGNTALLTYDAAGFLTKITDASGRTITFTKGPGGLIGAITDPANRTFTFSYTTQGYLSAISDPLGNAHHFEYDAEGNLNRVTDPRNNAVIKVTYDGNGRVSKLTEGEETWTYVYKPGERHTTKTDSANNTWTFEYNATGNITTITDALRNTAKYVFDGALNIVEFVDEGGNKTRYTYDQRGNEIARIDPLGNTWSAVYDPRLASVTESRGPRGDVTRATYDSRGNVTAITNAVGDVTKLTYDSKGLLSKITDPLGQSWQIEYDANGNVIRTIDPLGRRISKTFDILGRLTSMTDAESRTTRYSYDLAGRVIRVENALAGLMSYEYDSAGNLTAIIAPNGSKTTYEYDNLNRRTRVTNALQQVTTYTYDRRGRIETKRNAKGQTVRYTYDALDRLTRKTMPEDDVRYTWDRIGNLLTATDIDSSIGFEYDAANRLVKASTGITVGFASTVAYAYDAAGNRVSMTDPTGGVTTYTYDPQSRLTSTTDPHGNRFTFAYDPRSRRAEVTRPANLSTTYEYDAADQILSLVHEGGPGRLAYAFVYDKNGNRTAVADSAGSHTYTYDALDRLVRGGHPVGTATETYLYDAAGNRVSSHLSETYTHDQANRLTADAQFDYAYDFDGGRTTRTERGTTKRVRYDYDAEQRLTRIVFEDGTNANYRYDALGRRTAKIARGTTTQYVYDGLQILAEYTDLALTARYTSGPLLDETLSVYRSNASAYLQADTLGGIARIVSGSGASVASYSWDSFGRTLSQSGGRVAPYRFQGRELDEESGLYYFRARYYDPQAGRFLSEDPVEEISRVPSFANMPTSGSATQNSGAWQSPMLSPQGDGIGFEDSNHYAFTGNNPINATDPLGLMTCEGNPRKLGECLGKASRDARTWQSYCGKLPERRARALCWAVVFSGSAARIGFCYARFGGG